MMTITTAQNRKIWALKGELYLDEATLRDAVEVISGDRSISRLSQDQASKVIKHLESKKPTRGKQIKKSNLSRSDKAKHIVLMITPKQRAMINAMISKIKWQYDDGFERFLKKRLGIESIKTNDEVTTVKKSLENIIHYQHLNKGASE